MQAATFPKRSRTAYESGQAALVLVGVLALILLIGFGGYKYLESTGARLYESSETMDRGLRHLAGLEYMHPFKPPEDGVVLEDRAAVFAAVTAEAHAAMKGNLRKLNDLDLGSGDERPNLRVTASAIGALGDATLALGHALSNHDMALSEYLWTGLQLLRGGGYVEDLFKTPDVPPAPEPVVQLAGQHRQILDEIRDATAPSLDDANRGTVYWMGWGMASQSPRVWETPAIAAAAALIDSLGGPDSTGSAGSTLPRGGSPTPEPPTR